MRRGGRAILVVCLALTLVAGAGTPAGADDWPEDVGPNGTHFIEAPVPKTHSLRWTTRISDLPSGTFFITPLIVYDKKVIVNGSSTNSVVALHTNTGEVAWRFQPDPRKTGTFGGYPHPQQSMVENGIYYTGASNGILYALDAKTGQKRWSFQVTENDYNVSTGRVAVCDGRVFFETIGAVPSKGQHNVFALDARTGRRLWSTYAGAPDWPGEGVWPDFPANAKSPDLAALARNTRRFEARGGMVCFGNRAHHLGEDGILRLLDVETGELRGAYNVQHAGDLGFQVDGTVGITDPQTGAIMRGSLNNRLLRLLPSQEIEKVCGGKVCADEQQEQLKIHPGWRHPYGDCSATHDCGVVSIARGDVVPTYTESRNDGVLGGSVFAAGFGIAPWENGKRVVYAGNHDGHLYAMDFDDPINDQGEPSVFKAEMDRIPESLRDGKVSQRRDGKNLYTSRDASSCAVATRCQNGPWEHRASNVSSPLIAGGVVYISGSFAHKMYGFDWKTGERVWEYEVKWDDKAQYPPFGDTKSQPFTDLDELVQGTPAHDGRNLYFTANNGTVYAISLQETIARPRKNLAVLGSGVVPFIPKWKEQIGAFDYVWTPERDWYNPGYTSPNSTTAKQGVPAVPEGQTPLGYRGAESNALVTWPILLIAFLVAAMTWMRQKAPARSAIALDKPLLLGRPATLVESLDFAAKARQKRGPP
ncbi:MAG TPA: PQQ-binding-like beta-propeller repeat protein [Actinomycetota bacterium]|nr:PQQ-binding-like beta-propeller repeat protein [Actinomycetota bacterium]